MEGETKSSCNMDSKRRYSLKVINLLVIWNQNEDRAYVWGEDGDRNKDLYVEYKNIVY